MTVSEIISLCGGYNYNYTFAPRERIGYFYPETKVRWQDMTSYVHDNKEILDREVAHITALEKNSFRITYYVTKEDVEKINSRFQKGAKA